MVENEELFFTITDEDGNEVECETLMMFELEETGKSYIVYTDNTDDGEGNLNVYAASFDPEAYEKDNSAIDLIEIESDDEWALIEEVIDNIMGECECDDEDCDCGCHDHDHE